MSDLDSERVEALFERALACSCDADRRTFLDQACAGDSSLYQRVTALLAAHDAAGGFLNQPAIDSELTRHIPLSEGPGTEIGTYKLLQQIGEGGFGVVYMAEQKKPVSRKVALKIIKLGMDTKQVIARFEAERQALAMMEHHNIAKVLDAGATDTGRPYFVMELVKGEPITEYCDKHNLTVQARLELFQQVCHAVQHAHQKGVIHRDLKPTNVMITLHDGRPVPKVIDFGIAKATNERLTEKTVFTEYRQFIGTPEYMSPEQAEISKLDIDTRSDVYALGVLLYHLLTGTTPFNGETLRNAGYAEIQRIIRDEIPLKPSTRLATLETLDAVAQYRHTEPKKLGTMIRGDLDWIVMNALEKDRTRRYETANGFAMDVERYLQDEPVTARPPTASYRLRKFVRRNRAGVIAATLVVMALSLGIVGTTTGMFWALEQKSRAEDAEAGTRALMLDRETWHAIYEQRDFEKAIPLAKEACELEESRRGESLWIYLDRLACAYWHSGDSASAIALEKRAAELVPPDEVYLKNRLGRMYLTLGDRYMEQGKREEALSAYRRGFDLRFAAVESGKLGAGGTSLIVWDLLTHDVEEVRDPVRALRLAEKACELERDIGGEKLWSRLEALAFAQHMNGDTAAALKTQRQAAELIPDQEPHDLFEACQQRLAEYEAALAKKVGTVGDGDEP